MTKVGERTGGLVFRTALFVLLISVAFVLQALYAANMTWWRNAPDLGWFTFVESGHDVVAGVRPLGERSGIQVRDKFLAINGLTFKTWQERNAVIDWEIGHVNHYRIERQGQTIERQVTTPRLGFRQVFVHCAPKWIIGLLYTALGVIVFFMKPWYGQSWAFLAMSLLMGVFFPFTYFAYPFRPQLLFKVLIVAFALMPATIFHLTAFFPVKKAPWARRVMVAGPYALSCVILAAALATADRMTDVPFLLLNGMYLYLLLSVLCFLGSTIYNFLSTSSAAVRLQSTVVFIGMALAGVPPLVEGLLTILFNKGSSSQLLLIMMPLFFPLSIGYAIVRHDLFEIDTVIRRTYGYVLSTAAIVGAYAVLTSALNTVLSTTEASRSPFFTILFTILVVLLFRPLQERIQRAVDRIFYRQRYDYRKTIRGVSEAMTSILDTETIQRTLVGSLTREMFLENGLLLLPATGDGFRIGTVEGVVAAESGPNGLDAGDPLMRHIAAGEPVLRDDLDLNPHYEKERGVLRGTFDRFSSALMFPLRYKEELRGVISLGRKKSGKIFTPEDLDLLRTIASQSAIALENARLFMENLEKGRMEEELKIAHDIQMSMLPERPPQTAGLEIAARSVPAREVGGDFYDFLQLRGESEERLGVVVGDVSGKAVSGALVMAASRSIFRVLTGTNPAVASVMNIGNSCLLRDVKKGMFVAATYALFDGKERIMTLSNAGQPQPLLLRVGNEPAFVETAGDCFPLGIVGQASYEETSIPLAAGDIVVFYSDGVVEAMNGAEEIYGFERLLAAVRGEERSEAGPLMERILNDVRAFVDGSEPHDDLTLVVVRIE